MKTLLIQKISQSIFSLFFAFSLVTLDSKAKENSSKDTKLEKTKIILNWKAEPEFGAFYAAQINDIYKKQGLEVEIVEGGAGTPTNQMVASKQFDFGITNADDIIIAQERGLPLVALFAVYQTSPHAIMVHAEKNYKSLKDVYLDNVTLAMQKDYPYAIFMQKKFEKENLTDKLKAKIVPYLGGVGPFILDQNYAQQCFVTAEPLSAEKKGAKVKSFLIADEGFNPYITVVVTRKEVIEKNPELVKKFVLATREGLAHYLKDPSKTNTHMNKLNPSMDLETFAQSAKVQSALVENKDTKKTGLGTMTKSRWSTLIDQLFEIKLIKEKPKAEDLYRNY